MKKWTHKLTEREKIQKTAASIEAEQIKQLYSVSGEEVDRLVSTGVSALDALKQVADGISDPWLKNGFISIYRKIRGV